MNHWIKNASWVWKTHWSFILFLGKAVGLEGSREGSVPEIGLPPHETHYKNGPFPGCRMPEHLFPKQAASLRVFASPACRTRCKCRYPVAGTPAAKYLNVFADHINFSVFCEEFHEEFYHLEQFCNLKIRVLMACAYGLIFFNVKYGSIIIPKPGVFFNCKHSFPYIWKYYFQMFTFFILCIKIGFLKTRMSFCTLKL